MNKDEFMKEMKNPKNVYILISSDSRMIDIYLNRFKEAIQADNVVYGHIVPYGKLFKKKTLNVLYMPKITEDIFNRTEYIFIHTDKIDKRSAVYKNHKDRFIELKNDYTKLIMNHSNLNQVQAKQLARRCNNDLGIIENAIIIYNLSNCSYEEFTDYSSDIYLWVDNFIQKKPLPRIIDSPISVLALLSTNCQNILKIKQGNTKDLNPYVIKCLNKVKDCRDEKSLASIISTCFQLDCAIKKDILHDKDILNYLIIKEYKEEN